MGNKQNIETVNHWSDLVNLANELNESDDNDPGTAILEKLDFIINLIQQQDKQIIKSLNKKPRNWDVLIRLLSHSNHEIAKKVCRAIAYSFVFRETADYFLDTKKTPSPPEQLKKVIDLLKRLFIGKDNELQLEATRVFEYIGMYKEFKPNILECGILPAIIQSIKTEEIIEDKEPNNQKSHISKDLQRSCLKTILNLLKNEKDDKIKVHLMSLKANNIFVQTFSKMTNLETLKTISSVLALMAQCPECREDLIMNSIIEECERTYQKLDQDDLKILLVRIVANTAENDLGLSKIKKSEIFFKFQEAAKTCRNKTLLYHYLMAFLICSKDPDVYNILIKNKFLLMFESLSFMQVKESEDINALLYGINLFTKRATLSNLFDLFLIIINPLWFYIKRETEDFENLNLALECLANLSLRRDFQLYIANHEIFDKLIEYGDKLLTVNLKFKQEIEYDILLNYSRILSNIFINTNNKFLALNDSYLNLLKKFKLWVFDQLHQKHNLQHQIKEINEDLCLVEAMQFTHHYILDEEINKLKFSLKCVNSENPHIACKAASVCAHMALESEKRAILIEKHIIDHMIFLLSMKENSVVREGAAGLANILQFPDDMILWLKFDSNRLQIDAASNYALLLHGNPKSLSAEKGLYQNWGCSIKEGDVFEIPGEGIYIENKFTVTFWFLYQLSDKKKFRTLFQGHDGIGGHLVIDDNTESIGLFDEFNGNFLKSPMDLKTLTKGWNHIAVTYDNEIGQVIFHLNGKQAKSPINTKVKIPIKYIGNSKDKKEPFGILCDLRIYAFILSSEQIKNMSIYKEKQVIDNFPDRICDFIKDSKGVEELLKALKNYNRSTPFPEAQTEICRALAALATKNSSKMEILRMGGFELLSKLLNDKHMPLRIESSKALLHLS